jgi:hypothetical protein
VPNQLSPAALRRLMRYHARLEGAQQALQATEGAYRSLASNFEDALRSACEDASIQLPPPNAEAQIHIDWNTGDVTWQEAMNGQLLESPNGTVHEEKAA